MITFNREQLIKSVQLSMSASLDVIQGLLPPVNDRKSCNDNEEEYKTIIYAAKQTFGHFVPFLYAHLTNDGMSICEFEGWDEWEKLVDKYVSDCLLYDPPKIYPNTSELAAKIVDASFSEYLKVTTSPFSDVGFELSDGGCIEFPDRSDGSIRRIDIHGNGEDVRRPEDSDYAELRNYFPDDALYYQPEDAGDEGSTIASYQVYRDLENARKSHPDVHIEAFIDDDIEKPQFLDVENPTYGDPSNKPE